MVLYTIGVVPIYTHFVGWFFINFKIINTRKYITILRNIRQHVQLIVFSGLKVVQYGRNAIWYKYPANSNPGGRQGSAQTEMKRGYTDGRLSICPFLQEIPRLYTKITNGNGGTRYCKRRIALSLPWNGSPMCRTESGMSAMCNNEN